MGLRIVYVSSGGEGMTVEDVISWILSWSILQPEFTDWTFDQITGGIEEFLDKEAYYHIKTIFEKIKNG